MIYVGSGLINADHNRGYVYLSKDGWLSTVICHNPYLFYSNGDFNFDIPIQDIVVVFKIRKRTLINRIIYFFKKRLCN